MDLCNINDVKALLSRHGFHFSKSLGQNFLIQSWVPQDIAASSGADKNTGVMEIGPGIRTADLRTGQAGRQSGRAGVGQGFAPHSG